MTVKDQSDREKMRINCHRCNGRMGFKKFYGPGGSFYGWHCVLCGDILDAVILLHRLSQDAGIAIPDNEDEIMSLIKKYKSGRSQNSMNCESA